MSLHGISRDAWKRYAAGGSWYYEIEEAGYKYNLTDLAAALGLVQLARADELLAARRALAAGTAPRPSSPHRRSAGAAGGRSGRRHTPGTCTSSACISTASRSTGPRSSTRWRRRASGASVHFIPLHLHPYYRRALRLASRRTFPSPTRSTSGSISLPLWPGMTRDDVARVITSLVSILETARR